LSEIWSGAYYIEFVELNASLSGRAEIRIADENVIEREGDVLLL